MDLKKQLSIMWCLCILFAVGACGGGGGGGNNGPDTQAPSVPVDLVSVPVSTRQINLSWSASSDNRGVAGYNVYKLVTAPAVTVETFVGTAARSYSDAGLGESTHHCYQVSAYDATGNESARSAIACTTTMMEFFTLPSTGESLATLPTITLQIADTTRPLSYETVTVTVPDVYSYPTYTILNTAVTDSWTTLSWQQESDNVPRTWNEAQVYCNDLALAGETDWRLPSRKELLTIVHYGRGGAPANGPAFDPVFMMAPSTYPYMYWTASSYPSSMTGGSQAWVVDFNDGEANFYYKTVHHYVRCVRGGQLPSQDYKKFLSVTDPVVVDYSTGLTWHTLITSTSATWGDAISICEKSTLGGLAWRLPSIRELATLVDDTQNAPAIDKSMFTDSLANLNRVYWSSTTIYTNPSSAWGVYFRNGQIPTSQMAKTQTGAVRCVR